MELREYVEESGRSPFQDWMKRLDRPVRVRVRTRLDRIERGNFGDCKYLGDGVYELRIDFGPGYRVYFGKLGNEIVLLICGGDKSVQERDIRRAKQIWREYSEV